jgi:NADPH2:quinone reductase
MKAIRVERAGGPEELRTVDVPEPKPSAGEVLIRIHASGVNYADIMCREGSHPGMTQPPLIPGCEGSGIVTSCGPDATRFQEGDRVSVYSPPGGTYAKWMTAPEDYVLPIPDVMSFEDGAAFTHVFLTAYHALHTLGRANAGEWAVVTAAAGGVGTALIQLARVEELHVIAGVGSSEKLNLLAELGVEYTINYRAASLSSHVLELTGGRGADIVLESVGGAVFKETLECLGPLGRLVLFGIASGESMAVHPFDLLKTSSVFAALNLSVLFARAQKLVRHSWRELLRLYEAGSISPVIRYRFPLEQAAEAHRLMESRTSVGKLLLLPGGESP